MTDFVLTCCYNYIIESITQQQHCSSNQHMIVNSCFKCVKYVLVQPSNPATPLHSAKSSPYSFTPPQKQYGSSMKLKQRKASDVVKKWHMSGLLLEEKVNGKEEPVIIGLILSNVANFRKKLCERRKKCKIIIKYYYYIYYLNNYKHQIMILHSFIFL